MTHNSYRYLIGIAFNAGLISFNISAPVIII